MCLISVQVFLAQSLRSGVCFPLKYMYVVQGKLGLSKVYYVSWLNTITLTGDAAQFSQHHWNIPLISFTVTPHPGTHCQSSGNMKWFPLHFPLFSLEPVCVCVCVCVHVCVWREREREREREIGVEALWKVWDYFLQDFNWDIKTPFGCEKWRGKCVLKVLGQKIIALYCSLISHSMAAALAPLRPLPPPSWYFPRPFKPWVILSGSIPYWSCDLEQVASPLCVSVGLSVK